MTAELTGRLTVAACIGCGARSRFGECADGCADVPLDIVDAGPVDALAQHVKALEPRVRELRELTRATYASRQGAVPAVAGSTPRSHATACAYDGRTAPRMPPSIAASPSRPISLRVRSVTSC